MRFLVALLLLMPLATNAEAAAKKAAPAAQGKQGAKKAAATAAKQAPAAKRAAAKTKGKAAKGNAAPKASAAIVAAYAAMPVAERRAIQSDLIWSGDYNGVISDDFGERAIAAVKAYQAGSGAPETGTLTPQQRAALAAAAKARQEASGWRVVDDVVTGARLGVPIKHAPNASNTKTGMRWSSGRGEVQVETFRIAEPNTTLAATFEQQKKEPAGREVSYSVMRDNFFVLSGLQGLKRFYVRAQVKGNEVRGMTVMYDQAMEGIMDRVAVAMSSRFEPFPAAPPAPPPRRKVEYATGIVVDEIGHVITDSQAVDGCLVITLAGLGSAERVADSADLVLLRVYGARKLTPIALADASGAADVTLVGVADPDAQGGNAAATAITPRLVTREGARRAFESAPPLGFSGAAALGAQGRLRGVVQVRSPVVAGPSEGVAPAQLVPVEDLKTFLAEHSIAPATAGASSVEAAKSSVVRVICVRK